MPLSFRKSCRRNLYKQTNVVRQIYPESILVNLCAFLVLLTGLCFNLDSELEQVGFFLNGFRINLPYKFST